MKKSEYRQKIKKLVSHTNNNILEIIENLTDEDITHVETRNTLETLLDSIEKLDSIIQLRFKN